MAIDNSAAAKRTRALIVALREVGENKTADLMESSLKAGGTPKGDTLPHDAARTLSLFY